MYAYMYIRKGPIHFENLILCQLSFSKRVFGLETESDLIMKT